MSPCMIFCRATFRVQIALFCTYKMCICLRKSDRVEVSMMSGKSYTRGCGRDIGRLGSRRCLRYGSAFPSRPDENREILGGRRGFFKRISVSVG